MILITDESYLPYSQRPIHFPELKKAVESVHETYHGKRLNEEEVCEIKKILEQREEILKIPVDSRVAAYIQALEKCYHESLFLESFARTQAVRSADIVNLVVGMEQDHAKKLQLKVKELKERKPFTCPAEAQLVKEFYHQPIEPTLVTEYLYTKVRGKLSLVKNKPVASIRPPPMAPGNGSDNERQEKLENQGQKKRSHADAELGEPSTSNAHVAPSKNKAKVAPSQPQKDSVVVKQERLRVSSRGKKACAVEGCEFTPKARSYHEWKHHWAYHHKTELEGIVETSDKRRYKLYSYIDVESMSQEDYDKMIGNSEEKFGLKGFYNRTPKN